MSLPNWAAIPVALLFAGCAAAAVDPGLVVYSQPLSDGNTFACATCHALSEPAEDGLRRPGHPIGDATRRPSYKNGQLATFIEAANLCATEWMGASPFVSDDPRFLDLVAFLDRDAPESAPALSYDIVEPASAFAGVSAAGQALFNSSCTVCHGNNAAGTIRAPSLAFTELAPDYVARRIRTSGNATSPTYGGLTGGRMPFWSAQRLSDTEVADLVAFLGELQSGTLSGTGGTIGELGDCPSTHPSVGAVAQLTPKFHGVSGTATVINDCSIQIRNFAFDGSGIDVRIYGARGGDYGSGFSMSQDLVRPGDPYADVTLNLQLPSGTTLDDVEGISVWCVPVGVSFGDGLFSGP